MVEVGAIVLYANDVERTATFYRALGLHLDLEDHGEGPTHYATELGSVHVAIYPATAPGSSRPRRSGGDAFHGFFVDSLDYALSALTSLKTPILSVHEVMPWGCRFVFTDPDGRPIEVNQRLHCPADTAGQ
jgi:catechol 2,3-dioxygenase-like lactoylglutathione lyase family enzyme